MCEQEAQRRVGLTWPCSVWWNTVLERNGKIQNVELRILGGYGGIIFSFGNI